MEKGGRILGSSPLIRHQPILPIESRTLTIINIDGLVRSLFDRLPGESRGPKRLEINGFRLSPDGKACFLTFSDPINIELALELPIPL
jgi:hypothetical protein